MVSTNKGSFEVKAGYWAAIHALEPLSQYTAMLNAAESGTTQREGSSLADKIGAGAGVVGAIAGIAGLVKPSEKNEDLLAIDVINYCDYPVVPYKFHTEWAYLRESPRTIFTSDNTLIKISSDSGFAAYQSKMKPHFLVGSNPTVKVDLQWEMGDKSRWTVDHVVIDDVRQDIDYGAYSGITDQLACIYFTGNGDNPSFNVFFHTVMYDTAKTFIIFTKLGA